MSDDDGTINGNRMDELGLGWKNCKRLKQLDNIRPLHGKSELRGNNDLYYLNCEIFKDSVYHRRMTFGRREFRMTRLTGLSSNTTIFSWYLSSSNTTVGSFYLTPTRIFLFPDIG